MQSASGVLQISGDPSGSIYLDDGQVTFAWASWVPDLATRLRDRPDIPAKTRTLLLAGDSPDRDLGALLIEGKCLTKVALRAVLRSMIVDAMIVLTMPLPDETSIASTRFETPASHWAAPYARLRIDAARTQAEKKLAGLTQSGLPITAPLDLADLTANWAVLRREHWQVASRIDGSSSICDLAWSCGLSLTETIDCVSYLVKKGMCAPRTAATRAASGQAASTRPGSRQASTRLAAGQAAARSAASVRSRQTVSKRAVPKQAGPGTGEVLSYDFANGKKGSAGRRAAQPGSRSAVAAQPATRVAHPVELDDVSDASASAPSPEELRRVLEGLRKLT